MTTASNWDPSPQEREWYREVMTGDLGYLVRRDGVDRIKLDRTQEEIIRPFRPGEWTPEKEHRPMTVAQVAEICFLADRRLITFTHNPGLKKAWHDLKEEEKIAWMDKGPTKDPMRKALYQGITEALRPYFR